MSSATSLSGRVVRLGDDVNTDIVLAGEYLNVTDPDELAVHLLERFEPPVADRIGPGTILLAGRAFGGGSSREQAVLAIVARGVTALVAASFAGSSSAMPSTWACRRSNARMPGERSPMETRSRSTSPWGL